MPAAPRRSGLPRRLSLLPVCFFRFDSALSDSVGGSPPKSLRPPAPRTRGASQVAEICCFFFSFSRCAPWADPRPRRGTPPPPARGGLVKSRTSDATSAVLVLAPAHCGAARTVKNGGSILKKMKVPDSALRCCAPRKKPGTYFEKDESARRQTAPSSLPVSLCEVSNLHRASIAAL